MKRLFIAIALPALGAATVALAQQQSYQQTPQQPPASTSQQTTPTQADKEALMKDCMTQVRTANQGVDEKAIKAYCDKKVEEYLSPKSQEK